jgi:hypothetical protein
LNSEFKGILVLDARVLNIIFKRVELTLTGPPITFVKGSDVIDPGNLVEAGYDSHKDPCDPVDQCSKRKAINNPANGDQHNRDPVKEDGTKHSEVGSGDEKPVESLVVFDGKADQPEDSDPKPDADARPLHDGPADHTNTGMKTPATSCDDPSGDLDSNT